MTLTPWTHTGSGPIPEICWTSRPEVALLAGLRASGVIGTPGEPITHIDGGRR